MLKVEIDYFAYPRKRSKFALNNLSLFVEPGEIVGVVGRSGSGKSTIARIATGLITDKEGLKGIASVDGVTVAQPDAPVALVFQDYKRAVFPWLTVRQNLKLGSDQQTTQVESVAYSLGIHEIIEAYPDTLSGGQLQRVQLGRAILSGARFTVLDEPIASLDVITRRDVYSLVLEMAHVFGTGVLFISHEVEELISFCRRVYACRNTSSGVAEMKLFRGVSTAFETINDAFSNPEYQRICGDVFEFLENPSE